MTDLTTKVVKELLDYNPKTGEFRWKKRDRKYCKSDSRWKWWNTVYSGTIAGSSDSAGYVIIRIFNKPYFAHRLAWLYVYGEWPKGELDHINHITNANWIENLRESSRSQNEMNKVYRVDNTSGYKGVVWNKQQSKWQAQICMDGRYIYLGLFTNKNEAARIRDRAALKYHGEYANFNFPIEDYKTGD